MSTESADQLPFPEHAKLAGVEATYDTVIAFLAWCEGQGLHLCTWRDDSGMCMPISLAPERVAAKHVGIDMDALEVERRAMLDRYRQSAKADRHG